MKPLHVVALALINEKSEVLVSERPKDKDLGGLWEFPGGKVEFGETRIKALRREIKEELDYTLKTAVPLKSVTHKYREFAVKLDVWVSHDNLPDVSSAEGQAIQWVSLVELKGLNMPEADKPILESLESYLLKNQNPPLV